MPLHKDLAVALFVPTLGGPEGKRSGVFGTGFPISRDLVLTSRHVVCPDNRDPQSPIRVRWYYLETAEGEPPGWLPVTDDALVWDGGVALDAALIRCPIPESLSSRFSPCRLSARRPRSGEPWESIGFANASSPSGIREPASFSGSLLSMAEGAGQFELVELAPPSTADDWCGASGMPVCANGEILGVVAQVPPSFDARKLLAVPAWRLLEDAGFRKQLGPDVSALARVEQARKGLHRLLGRSEAATRALGAAIDCDIPDGSAQAGRGAVVEALLYAETPLAALFDAALDAQDELRSDSREPDARVVRELMLALLPAIQDASVLDSVAWERESAAGPLLALPTQIWTVAEIIMAGLDGRPVQIWPERARQRWPRGIYELPEPPESGRDADGKQFEEDWRAHLVETLGTGPARFERAFGDYLARRFIQFELRGGVGEAARRELMDAVAEELRQERATYYYIVPMPDHAPARAPLDAVIARLKAQFPPVEFLRLAGGSSLAEETSRYGKLRAVLLEPSPEDS